MYRELTHYKGDPDPFKGDVLNQKVRDAAKETLDAIFQATDTNYGSNSSKPTLTVKLPSKFACPDLRIFQHKRSVGDLKSAECLSIETHQEHV